MTRFSPTHEITTHAEDGVTVTGKVLVQLVENELSSWPEEELSEGEFAPGPAYTEAEWEAAASAAWAREADGSWLFQGAVVNCSVRKL